MLMAVMCLSLPAWGGTQKDYLYQRDVNIPAFQTLREFFDMPNRPGTYQIVLVSDSIGPLTFRVIRVKGEQEHTVKQKRSYRLEHHEFETTFENPHGAYDLIVEIANSNPAASAKVTVSVFQLSR